MIGVVVIAYNRVEPLRRLLDSILHANYSQEEVPLIISIDKSDTNEVVDYARSFSWPYGEKKVISHPRNLGLRKHILSVGEYTNEYEAIIVLEDDLVVSKSFYNYATETVRKYSGDERIAGVSLYGFSTNHHNYLPFIPDKNEYDVYLFQNAMSWGQIWMKHSWDNFIKWYSENSDEFGLKPHLPYSICHWGKNSWLKYHVKYCIENRKYFVYPYVPLTFCSGAAGEHSKTTNNSPHNILQQGNMFNYRLPDYEDAVRYDAFYEREGVQLIDDLCFDLYGEKGNRQANRYWLTSKRASFKCIRSFGLLYYPIERNIIDNIEGNSIFLYDTTVKEKKPTNNTFSLLDYFYKIHGLLRLMKTRGLFPSVFQVLIYVIKKR